MDPAALANWPFTADAQTFRLNLTDADDGLALAVGGYVAHLVTTDLHGATLRLGAVAVPPVDDDAAGAEGMVLPPGVMFTMTVREAADLHAIMNTASATGTLYLTKVR